MIPNNTQGTIIVTWPFPPHWLEFEPEVNAHGCSSGWTGCFIIHSFTHSLFILLKLVWFLFAVSIFVSLTLTLKLVWPSYFLRMWKSAALNSSMTLRQRPKAWYVIRLNYNRLKIVHQTQSLWTSFFCCLFVCFARVKALTTWTGPL